MISRIVTLTLVIVLYPFIVIGVFIDFITIPFRRSIDFTVTDSLFDLIDIISK